MISSYDAAVVGGGIVGSSIAYHLARSGSKMVLLDHDDKGAATAAGVGIVFPRRPTEGNRTRGFGLLSRQRTTTRNSRT
ncbi:FAD-dependent oxidoreductase (plasmid) [Natrinema zhouii]|uniref:FAD-dependent oxidoreductase n=1 Tax=Natrinema zhouii TaxID=1710539 RepID=UPI001CFF55DA|nr:FAD-dependent oxidoreductase [Natrinema zhouii]UHQ98860.1 FAD-dependent oxidoreductase [Natrinema zhouii]